MVLRDVADLGNRLTARNLGILALLKLQDDGHRLVVRSDQHPLEQFHQSLPPKLQFERLVKIVNAPRGNSRNLLKHPHESLHLPAGLVRQVETVLLEQVWLGIGDNHRVPRAEDPPASLVGLAVRILFGKRALHRPIQGQPLSRRPSGRRQRNGQQQQWPSSADQQIDSVFDEPAFSAEHGSIFLLWSRACPVKAPPVICRDNPSDKRSKRCRNGTIGSAGGHAAPCTSSSHLCYCKRHAAGGAGPSSVRSPPGRLRVRPDTAPGRLFHPQHARISLCPRSGGACYDFKKGRRWMDDVHPRQRRMGCSNKNHNPQHASCRHIAARSRKETGRDEDLASKTIDDTAVGLLAATPAAAESLEPGEVASDAKWLMHVNVDEIRYTSLAQDIQQQLVQGQENQARLDWVQDKLGINLRQDLHGFTFYDRTYAPDEGVGLVHADYDRGKIVAPWKSSRNIKRPTIVTTPFTNARWNAAIGTTISRSPFTAKKPSFSAGASNRPSRPWMYSTAENPASKKPPIGAARKSPRRHVLSQIGHRPSGSQNAQTARPVCRPSETVRPVFLEQGPNLELQGMARRLFRKNRPSNSPRPPRNSLRHSPVKTLKTAKTRISRNSASF